MTFGRNVATQIARNFGRFGPNLATKFARIYGRFGPNVATKFAATMAPAPVELPSPIAPNEGKALGGDPHELTRPGLRTTLRKTWESPGQESAPCAVPEEASMTLARSDI